MRGAASPRLGAGTRARLAIGKTVRVEAHIPLYGNRVGTVAEWNAGEIGVTFGRGSVWFRPAELTAEPSAAPAGPVPVLRGASKERTRSPGR